MKTRVLELGLSLAFCLGLSACNKEEFYQKEFLNTPTDIPSADGSANGGTQGSTQGGVDSGVTSGSTGGTTGGSTTGGVDGSTAGGTTGGSTTGGVDGSTAGGTTGGSTTGGVDGSTAGGTTGGSTTGGVDGSTAGGTTGGSTTGGVDGSTAGGTTGGSTTGGVDGSTAGGTTGGSTTGGVDGSTAGGTTGGSTTGGTYGDCNNGHGNDADQLDESNPTIGLEPKCHREIFHQSAEQTKKLDVLWIIDNSGSMEDEQDALGSNFSAFIDDFITKNVDFKMAITTTDTSSLLKKGKMVNGSDVKLTSAAAQSNPVAFKSNFNDLVRVGISGSGNEKGLEASEGFMEKYAASFLRADAYLAVVIISDEEDQSPKSVEAYTDYLKSFKANAGLVKTYSVVDVNNSNCCQTGITTGSERYKLASDKTSGIVADIRNDFYGVLSDMGNTILNLLDSFALAHEPVPGTLKVYVNNVETTNFTYDSTSRSIKFNQNSLPPVGAEIKVVYVK